MFRRKDNTEDKSDEQIELVTLKTVNSDIELGLLKNILDDNKIAYIVKDQGAGGHMRIITGSSSPFATEILVDKRNYEEAKKIVEQFTFE